MKNPKLELSDYDFCESNHPNPLEYEGDEVRTSPPRSSSVLDGFRRPVAQPLASLQEASMRWKLPGWMTVLRGRFFHRPFNCERVLPQVKTSRLLEEIFRRE